MPDENVTHRPLSNAPIVSSSAVHDGLPYRPYATSPPPIYVEASVTGTFSGASGSVAGRPLVTASVCRCSVTLQRYAGGVPVVIANPMARGAQRAVAALRAAGAPEPRWTTGPHDADRLAADALATGADAVIAVGGDGTVRAVADRLAHTRLPLGIMPAGTANLFARNLRLPLRAPRRAAHIALRGALAAVDLGSVVLHRGVDRDEPRRFLVVVGIGHDAAAVEASSLARKRRLGWAAYVEAGMSRVMAPPFTVHAQFDDTSAEHVEAWTVLVHNAAQMPVGMRVVPDTRLDDGLLHVAVVSPRRLLHWGRIAASGMGIARAEGVLHHRSARRVALWADRIPVQLDGDALGVVTGMDVGIEPACLIVRTEA